MVSLHVNGFARFSVWFFWINVVVCLALGFVLARLEGKYQNKKKKLKKLISGSDMTNVRWLFQDKLKEHGIEGNESIANKNRIDEL